MKILIWSVALSILLSMAASADDTDIYLNPNKSGSKPYLMLVFDYRTDMTATFCGGGGGSKKPEVVFAAPKKSSAASQSSTASATSSSVGANSDCAALVGDEPDLLKALTDLIGSGSADNLDATIAVFKVVFDKFEGIHVGLMAMNNENGGTVLRGYREFQKNDANGAKQELIDILKSIPRGGSGANFFHEVSPKELHAELYRYLNGDPIQFGKSTANNFGGTASPNFDSRILSGTAYISPFSDTTQDFSCSKLYEIYATSGNAGLNKDGDADTFISTYMNNSATDDKFTGMVSHMTNNDLLRNVPGKQSLKSWFIQMGTAATQVDSWVAAAGTTDQFMILNQKNKDLYNVRATLEAAFVEALSLSSTFVAASVPVNVFNRIQTVDNFYIALFEASAQERWGGNIKKFKLQDKNVPTDGIYDEIVDSLGISAFNGADGRIKYEALSFWTDASKLPAADPEKSEVAGRDGRTVTRGGAGQKIPQFGASIVSEINAAGSRQLFVEPSGGSSFSALEKPLAETADFQRKILNLDTSAPIDSTTKLSAEKMILWARGIDVDDDDKDGLRTDSRPWLLGDAVHSRPLALNYGATTGYSATNPLIRLFMGTNDGFFHIFENTTSGGAESGKELFAFIPQESLPILQRLRSNTGSSKHPYGVDGEPVALVNDKNNDGTIQSGEEVYVYFGMRRGGNSYYALDVSNPASTPTLKWKITNTGDFTELGMTFSTPVVAKLRFGATPTDVLIFGGGYDAAYDNSGTRLSDFPATPYKGAALYIVDARSGQLIWKATQGSSANSETRAYHPQLRHAIPSQVATLDSNHNGIVDRLYVGDLSGLLWRIDLPEGTNAAAKAQWKLSILADLDDGSEAEDQRMFHSPDIIQSKDSSGAYDGILITTGDRENPLETADQNYAYFVKDRSITSGSPSATPLDDDNLPDMSACILGTESICTSANLQSGWRIKLTGKGEKGLATPLVAAGKLFFTTYTPAKSGSCSPAEGSGELYAVNLNNASAAYPTLGRPIDIGPGIPPGVTAIGNDTLILPSAGIVKLDSVPPNNDKTKLIQAGGKPMHIIYWRETGVDEL